MLNASFIITWTFLILSTKFTNAFVPRSQVGTFEMINDHKQKETDIPIFPYGVDMHIDPNHPTIVNRRNVIASSIKQITTSLIFLSSFSQTASAQIQAQAQAQVNVQAQVKALQDTIETNPYGIVYGSDDIMNPKAHGTSDVAVQEDLRFGVSRKLADRICCYNRYFAELGGYYQKTNFESVVLNSNDPITFYDR